MQTPRLLTVQLVAAAYLCAVAGAAAADPARKLLINGTSSSSATACGRHNQPACSADPPQYMLPYCTEPGVTAMFMSWPIGLNSDESRRQLKGWCWRIPADCGTGVGKPCCPGGYHMNFNPPLKQPEICSGSGNDDDNNPKGALVCKPDPKDPATIMYNDVDSTKSYIAGTCMPNPSDCGELGKSCCSWVSGCCTVTKCLNGNECQFNDTTKAEKCVAPSHKKKKAAHHTG